MSSSHAEGVDSGGMAEPFASGNIVALREPYKMGDWWSERPPGFTDQAEWKAWQGYTHGIVAEVIDRGLPLRLAGRTLPGPALRVSLHLYDPARALLYVHEGFTVPAYVDFHISELRPHKVAADDGYATILDLDAETLDDEAREK